VGTRAEALRICQGHQTFLAEAIDDPAYAGVRAAYYNRALYWGGWRLSKAMRDYEARPG
jgi:hypothetical protein